MTTKVTIRRVIEAKTRMGRVAKGMPGRMLGSDSSVTELSLQLECMHSGQMCAGLHTQHRTEHRTDMGNTLCAISIQCKLQNKPLM